MHILSKKDECISRLSKFSCLYGGDFKQDLEESQNLVFENTHKKVGHRF